MEEIEYRAWLIEYKVMLPVIQLTFGTNPAIKGKDEWFEKPRIATRRFQWGSVNMSGIDTTEGVILIQYIGIKDKNEKKIFIGDIIKGELGICRGEIIAKVAWNKENLSVCVERLLEDYTGEIITERYDIYEFISKLEIIGNEFENPKLIKVYKRK